MSFLGMGTLEIVIILLVAFIFLGPERMVDAARTLGKWSGELRRMGSSMQAEMDDIVAEDAPPSQARRPNAAARRAGAPTQPLDREDAPPDSEAAAAQPPDDTDGPVAFRSGADSAAEPLADEAQPARNEGRL